MQKRLFEDVDNFEKWKELAKSNDYRCVYCGLDFLESPVNFSIAEVDHFVPASTGGKKVVSACRFCNKLKRNKSFGTREEAMKEIANLKKEYLRKYEFYELKRKNRG
jgi:5-methylcytosine-specific restriction endonuclease McrA